ncbi:hypothetical protein K438DRAFT_2025360 [Mycena galopus ATCC 62051]|nr:hypothetical protein K438DRAFT_2025360 [Mycena galopus ATCC 62051]
MRVQQRLVAMSRPSPVIPVRIRRRIPARALLFLYELCGPQIFLQRSEGVYGDGGSTQRAYAWVRGRAYVRGGVSRDGGQRRRSKSRVEAEAKSSGKAMISSAGLATPYQGVWRNERVGMRREVIFIMSNKRSGASRGVRGRASLESGAEEKSLHGRRGVACEAMLSSLAARSIGVRANPTTIIVARLFRLRNVPSAAHPWIQNPDASCVEIRLKTMAATD